MIKSFEEIKEKVLESNKIYKLSLAGSDDMISLEAITELRKMGIIEAYLVGDKIKTEELLKKMGEKIENYKLLDIKGDKKISDTAFTLLKDKKVNLVMKGLIHTNCFMKGLLNDKNNLITENNLLSQATLFEDNKKQKLIIITDCAINIYPNYKDKFKIIENAVQLAHDIGYEKPKVAVVAPVETVNPKMESTIDASMLSKAAERGQIKGCIVDGPLGFDNSISSEASEHKKINSKVAGNADILIMPELATGNVLSKSIRYFTDFKMAGAVIGGVSEIIMTSRTDTVDTKINSILLSIYRTMKKGSID